MVSFNKALSNPYFWGGYVGVDFVIDFVSSSNLPPKKLKKHNMENSKHEFSDAQDPIKIRWFSS